MFTTICSTKCERDDVAFMFVDAVARCSCAYRSKSMMVPCVAHLWGTSQKRLGSGERVKL